MSEFEHGKMTPWGYIIDTESLPDFITSTEFNLYTNNKFSGDLRIDANIPSATTSIRNYCGWHISPNLTCGMLYRVQDLRDAFIGSDLLIQLPATFVTSVDKVVLDAVLNPSTGLYEGEEIDDFDIGMGSGLVRIYDVGRRGRKSNIFIKYQAGFPKTEIEVVKELTAHRVVHAVSSSYGVMSESVGGVSVSYNASWAGNTRSTSLPDDNREVLETYKVKGVF